MKLGPVRLLAGAPSGVLNVIHGDKAAVDAAFAKAAHVTKLDIVNNRLSYPITYWNTLALMAALGIVLCVHLSADVAEHAIQVGSGLQTHARPEAPADEDLEAASSALHRGPWEDRATRLLLAAAAEVFNERGRDALERAVEAFSASEESDRMAARAAGWG